MKRMQPSNARANLYALLARLFTYPLDVEAITLVAGLSLDGAPTAVASLLRGALAQMQAALVAGGEFAARVETLNREATRLFEGPGQPAAPPYGSFYLNARQLMGPEAVAVRQAYLAARLLPEQDGHLPPDHLALELGFLAALGETVLGPNSEPALVAAREFLARHLLTWIPAWRADVLAAAPQPFFAGLATLTQVVLEADLVWLDDVIPGLAPEEMNALGVKK